MIGILHFGDIRVGSNTWKYGEYLQRLRDGFSRFEKNDRQDVELLVVSGNLTESGTADQFTQLADLLEEFADFFPGNDSVRVFAAPGPRDLPLNGMVADRTNFETFLRRFVPQDAVFKSVDAPSPYVIKLKAVSLVGLVPIDPNISPAEAPDAAASQLLHGVALLEGFCARQDSVPKIVVSSRGELATGDPVRHPDFRRLCSELRTVPLLDLHLFSQDALDSSGPRAFGLPVPSVACRAAPCDGGGARMNLVLFRDGRRTQRAEPEDFVRETELKTVALDDPESLHHPGRPGQPFRVYRGDRKVPSFAACFASVLDQLKNAVEKGKRVIAIEGLAGSGKQRLFTSLENDRWLPEKLGMATHQWDNRHGREQLAQLNPHEDVVLAILHDRRHTLGQDDIREFDAEFKEWLRTVGLRYRCVIYLCSHNRVKFDTDGAVARRTFQRFTLPAIREDEYRTLVDDVSRLVPVSSAHLHDYVGTQIGLIEQLYELCGQSFGEREPTWPYSPAASRELLESCGSDSVVQKLARDFLQSIERLQDVVGGGFVKLVKEQLGGTQLPGTPVKIPLTDIRRRLDPNNTKPVSLEAFLKTLEEFRVARTDHDAQSVTVRMPYPFLVGRTRHVVRLCILATDEVSRLLRNAIADRADKLDHAVEFLSVMEDLDRANHIVLHPSADDARNWDAVLGTWTERRAEELCDGRCQVFVGTTMTEDQLRKVVSVLPLGLLVRVRHVSAGGTFDQMVADIVRLVPPPGEYPSRTGQ